VSFHLIIDLKRISFAAQSTERWKTHLICSELLHIYVSQLDVVAKHW